MRGQKCPYYSYSYFCNTTCNKNEKYACLSPSKVLFNGKCLRRLPPGWLSGLHVWWSSLSSEHFFTDRFHVLVDSVFSLGLVVTVSLNMLDKSLACHLVLPSSTLTSILLGWSSDDSQLQFFTCELAIVVICSNLLHRHSVKLYIRCLKSLRNLEKYFL